MLEKTEEQSIIDNPETIGTLDTQDTWRRQTQHNNNTEKTKKMSNTDPTNNTFLSIVDFVFDIWYSKHQTSTWTNKYAIDIIIKSC